MGLMCGKGGVGCAVVMYSMCAECNVLYSVSPNSNIGPGSKIGPESNIGPGFSIDPEGLGSFLLLLGILWSSEQTEPDGPIYCRVWSRPSLSLGISLQVVQ